MPDEAAGRRLDWEWAEVVLACDLVERNGWRPLSDTDPRVIELSALLQRMQLHPVNERRSNFRNVNSVRRKTYDIATWHPDQEGRARTHGGRTDRQVIAEFRANPERMHAWAEVIRKAAAEGDSTVPVLPEIDENPSALEGQFFLRWHVGRERNRRLRERKIVDVMHRCSALACEVCSFDFEKTYGERGNGYIECHHVAPLHVTGPIRNTIEDLALLCANCHRMVHRRQPWPTPAELRGLIHDQPGTTK
jgi:5-methylcytosine-specific restriction protein A